MSSRRVRVGACYIYSPNLMDACSSHLGEIKEGDKVKVVNKFGCPKANTMGMCYVEKDSVFIGLVCTNSLIPMKEWNKRHEEIKAG